MPFAYGRNWPMLTLLLSVSLQVSRPLHTLLHPLPCQDALWLRSHPLFTAESREAWPASIEGLGARPQWRPLVCHRYTRLVRCAQQNQVLGISCLRLEDNLSVYDNCSMNIGMTPTELGMYSR